VPFLIDSNVLIDVSRGNVAAIRYVDGLPEPWAISQVTAMELIVGARDKRELATVDSFLEQYPVVPLSQSIGEEAYRLLKTYAKSHGLHVFDSLVAATAMENALTLVTLNRKHYQMIAGLLLEVPDYLTR
jgi:predicted nucleic acid-binding protein